MAVRGDLIAVVEASHDPAATETLWLQNVANAFAQVLQPGGGLLACHVDTSRQCRWIEQARNQNSGRGEDALEVWKGLIHGEWSLVESFDVDGRRFLVAHRNPEAVRDPRGLNSLESRVVALAAKGHSDKLIAYHLGVAEGTVSACLSHALRKLNISGRINLVRQLGPRAEHDSL